MFRVVVPAESFQVVNAGINGFTRFSPEDKRARRVNGNGGAASLLIMGFGFPVCYTGWRAKAVVELGRLVGSGVLHDNHFFRLYLENGIGR